MTLSDDTIVKICNKIARIHGEDIAHDVVVRMLTHPEPIRYPRTWAARCAISVVTNQYNSAWSKRVRLFSEIGLDDY